MDWKNLGISVLVVFALMTAVGMVICLASSQLQCSKIDVSQSAIQGSIFASVPTLVYAISAAFLFVRKPFSTTLRTFGITEDIAPIVGVGYVTMISAWVTAVWAIHTIEIKVCKPDNAEMTAFKTKLLEELHQKELAKEKQGQSS